MPRVASVGVQVNVVVMLGMAAVWMLEVRVTQVVMRTMMRVEDHLRGVDHVVGSSEGRSLTCGWCWTAAAFPISTSWLVGRDVTGWRSWLDRGTGYMLRWREIKMKK